MKKSYFLLMALLSMSVGAQTISFGSPPLKARLLECSVANGYAKDVNGNPIRIDTNANGEIEVEEAQTVYQLNLYLNTATIYNLNGMEHFSNIWWLDIGRARPSNTDLAAMFPNLTELYFNNAGSLSTLVHDINISGLDLRVLECIANASMIPYLTGTGSNGLAQFPNLERLHCGDNNNENAFNVLDFSGLTNLKFLDCSYNELTSLNITGLAHLEDLMCGYNSLTALNLTGCTALKTVYANTNSLQNMAVNGLPNLVELYLNENPAMTQLHLSNVSSLKTVLANDCALTGFTVSGAPALEMLDCTNNAITSLDLIGLDSLANALFSNNALTSLNVQNCPALNNLVCSDNQLQTLDISSNPLLVRVSCDNNNLTQLFLKNGKSNYSASAQPPLLSFSGNPGLTYICGDDNEINGIQSQAVGYGYANCTVNSYCSFVPGGTYYTIQGSHKFDDNNNGCDVIDPVFKNLKFKITSGSTTGYAISGASGNYSLPFGSGSYTIRPQFEVDGYFNSNPATRQASFPSTPSPVTQDFCITRLGSKPDIEVIVIPEGPARPGFDAHYKIICRNKGNQMQSGTINLAFNDAVLDLVSATPAVNAQSANHLEWAFSNLMPFDSKEIRLVLNVNSPVETPPVNGGDLLAFNATANSLLTDMTPEDNADYCNQYVVNSFDPNDKTCLEGSTITPEMAGKYINYVIRFENTGSFAAENIVVKDMIDTNKFDVSSLIPLTASHAFMTRVINPNQVEFIFQNINLPFDDANNDGYVAFKIKTKPTLVVGDSFSNAASIYFDYNHPIVTDPAVTTISVLETKDFEFSDYLSIYPNPTDGVLNIQSKNNLEISSAEIYNALGQLVMAITQTGEVAKIDVSQLGSGNYFIRIHSDKGTTNAKFAKK